GTIVKTTTDATTYNVFGTHTYFDESTTGRFPTTQAFPISITVQQTTTSVTLTNSASILEELLPNGTRGTSSQRFVSETYRDVLGRGVDQNGLNAWTAQYDSLLAAGIATNVAQGTIVYRIMTDSLHEYGMHVVEVMYEQYLGRQIGLSDGTTPATFANMIVTSIDNYQTTKDFATERVRAIILGSPEYFAKHGSNNPSFVDALYRDVLGRSSAGDAGAAAMVAALNAGTVTREQAAFNVLLSPEGTNFTVALEYVQV